MGMELLVANITGKTRRETLNGREHIVAPLSLIVPGILDGSGGPLLYPLEELAKNPSVWNGVPIVVNHPMNGGNQTSARTPAVMNKSAVGTVYNASVNGKLSAEGWFDVKNTERVDGRILHALESGHTVELSTGLMADRVPIENESDEFNGEFNGKKYNFVARNYRPDHLAILPDTVGACSVQDGCGVMVNESETKKTMFGYIAEYFKTNNIKTGGQNMADLSKVDKAVLVDNIIANCDCWSNEDRETMNGFSDEKLTKLKELAEKSKAQEAVVNAAKQGFEDQQGNSHTFNDKTGKWESKLKEKKKEEVVANTNEDKKAGNKPQTSEDWMKSAPAEIQSTIRNAMRIEAEEKSGLITKLATNLKDGSDKTRIVEGLQIHNIETLRDLVTLVPVVKIEPKPSYAGAAVPLGNVGQDVLDEDDILALPTINWSEKA